MGVLLIITYYITCNMWVKCQTKWLQNVKFSAMKLWVHTKTPSYIHWNSQFFKNDESFWCINVLHSLSWWFHYRFELLVLFSEIAFQTTLCKFFPFLNRYTGCDFHVTSVFMQIHSRFCLTMVVFAWLWSFFLCFHSHFGKF